MVQVVVAARRAAARGLPIATPPTVRGVAAATVRALLTAIQRIGLVVAVLAPPIAIRPIVVGAVAVPRVAGARRIATRRIGPVVVAVVAMARPIATRLIGPVVAALACPTAIPPIAAVAVAGQALNRYRLTLTVR
jgi:hypothetical protein